MKNKKILIVEDDEVIREELAEYLSERYQIVAAEDGEAARECFRRGRFDLVILDLHLPDCNGLSLIEMFRRNDETQVLVITAFPKVQTAIRALKTGAFDYVNKPFDIEELDILIARALQHGGLQTEVTLRRRQQAVIGGVERILGASPLIERLRDRIKRVAAAPDTIVLVRGESGTGKELVAEAIHHESGRRDQALVRMSCSSTPASMIAPKLFGYEKGAFTGAETSHRGLIELAHRGTMFIDEIGDLPFEVQPRLLRALDGASVRRVGGTRDIDSNVRFIIATNCDLEKMVAEGVFRRELLFRIKVFEIFVPPLRTYQDDVPTLAHHFLNLLRDHLARPVTRISPASLTALRGYDWPGNVRELRNVIERALILSRGDTIEATDLPTLVSPSWGIAAQTPLEPAHTVDEEIIALNDLLAAVTRRHILRIYRMVGSNKSRAAEMLQMSRTTLREKLKQYGEL